MKRLLLIIAISCMPFLSGVAVAADTDTIPDAIDNCPNVDNEDQKDTDGDRIGDECDASDTTILNPHLRYGFANPAETKRLGFGFAQPIITIIPGYTNAGGDYKPVVIIAGGYDPTKDYRGVFGQTATGDPAIGTPSGDPVTYSDFVHGSGPKSDGVRTEDKVGNAIYFLDALSGDVVARIEGRTNYHDQSVTDAITAPANGTHAISGAGIITAAADENGAGEIIDDRLKHSIPATVTIVDSQGDGITDRLYFIDVVGNIWRLDLNVTDDNTNIAKLWRLEPFAALGAEGKASGTTYAANERRFFNQVDVVRTRKPGGNANVDALLVGSGNIADPKGKTVGTITDANSETGLNAFFMVYDDQTQPIAKGVAARTKITLANLYAVPTGSEASTDTAADTVETQLETTNKGWYLNLSENEKVVSAATTVNGATYFTTIVANPNTTGCVAPSPLPASYIYAINMHNAKGLYNGGIIDGTTTTYYSRSKEIGNGQMAFQQLDPFVATDGDVTMILPGGQEEDVSGSDGEDKKLQGAGSYWRTEGQ